MNDLKERLEELGIPYEDLRKAMILIRDFRAKCLLENLDARAVRIAILFCEMIDRDLAKRRISAAVEVGLLKISSALAQETMSREAPPHA